MSNINFQIEDATGDTFDVQESVSNTGDQLYFVTSQRGTFIAPEQVVEVRDALTAWLIENGHEDAPAKVEPAKVDLTKTPKLPPAKGDAK